MCVRSRLFTCSVAVLLVLAIAEFGGGVSAQEEDGATARLKVLSGSLDADSIAEIRELVTRGADVNVKNERGFTPLFMATAKGHLEIVKFLLASKADVGAAGENNVTPLLVASQYGFVEIIKLLLAAKADVNGADKYGGTSLFLASMNGHAETVRLLLASKADVNAANRYGVTPLWQASWKGHTEIVKLLLASKADVNASNKTNGVTPLLVASGMGYVEIVKLLLANKADINAKGTAMGEEHTPLSMAKQKGHEEISELLRQYAQDHPEPAAKDKVVAKAMRPPATAKEWVVRMRNATIKGDKAAYVSCFKATAEQARFVEATFNGSQAALRLREAVTARFGKDGWKQMQTSVRFHDDRLDNLTDEQLKSLEVLVENGEASEYKLPGGKPQFIGMKVIETDEGWASDVSKVYPLASTFGKMAVIANEVAGLADGVAKKAGDEGMTVELLSNKMTAGMADIMSTYMDE